MRIDKSSHIYTGMCDKNGHRTWKNILVPLSIAAALCISACSDDSGDKSDPKDPSHVCGDGVLDIGESCDKSALGDKTCQSWSECIGGSLGCNASCEFDKSGCYECTNEDTSRCTSGWTCSNGRCVEPGHVVSCGDNLAEGNEECDGSDLHYKSCADFDGFSGGILKCSNCHYDTSECVGQTVSCGNNQADENEECDGNDLKGKSCADFDGFTSGILKCSNCHYDTSECIGHVTTCGDNLAEGNEECDGSDLKNKSCSDFDGFVDGTLKCSNCHYDTGACVECTESNLTLCKQDQICPNNRCVEPGHTISCGDNLAEGTEECDGNDLRNKTCANFEGFADGTLKCNQCGYDTSDCIECSMDSHCAGRQDGKTHCESNVCVKPSTPTGSSGKIVISQVYSGGGNSNAVYNTKYVELLNIDDKTVDISNWSLQYGSSDNDTIASTCILPNSVSIPKGGYYLIALQSGSNGADIITPDHTCSSLSPAATKGKLFLVNNSNALPNSIPDSGYVDAIGYGKANWSEGKNPVAALSAKTAAFRKEGGCVDTNNNGNDFEVKPPDPRNSKTPANLCDGSVPPTPSGCGNGILDDGEDCDGSKFSGNKTTCKSWNSAYESGNVSCQNCQINYSQCVTSAECGNGKLDAGEDCDGSKFSGNKKTCKSWDSAYESGNVSCQNCQIDYSQCVTPTKCGNGQLDAGEDCDGKKFSGNKTTCESWDASYRRGTVSCKDCQIDYTNCSTQAPECSYGQSECIEKQLSQKNCDHEEGVWYTSKCPSSYPYCKEGEEECSHFEDGDSCTPERYRPHVYYQYLGYGNSAYTLVLCTIKHAQYSSTYTPVVHFYDCGLNCTEEKYGIGLMVGSDSKDKALLQSCSDKGKVEVKYINQSATYYCAQCNLAKDGHLYWFAVPATYTVESSKLKCTPWTVE